MERILNNVILDKDGCWVWINSLNSSGYGQMMIDGEYWNSHRYVYNKVYGGIGEGLVVRHLCHNPSCCNPNHLEEGTHLDNYHDSIEKHRESYNVRAIQVEILGKVFTSKREAIRETGLSAGSLIKYVKDGVFDVESYRKGCKVVNVVPKV